MSNKLVLPATRLVIFGVPKMAGGAENVLRITGLHGSGENQIAAELIRVGVTYGPKADADEVRMLIDMVEIIASGTIFVTRRPSSVFAKVFPFEAEVEWTGPLAACQ